MRPIVKRMPARAMSHSNSFSGTTTPGSMMKTKLENDVKVLSKIAAKEGVSNEEVATKVLSTQRDELERYVRSKGEVPVRPMNGLIVQSALLRMEDICVIARTCNMPESDALAHILEAESEAVQTNTAAKNAILTPSTQACLAVVYNNLTQLVNRSTGTTDICGALDYIRKTSATPLNHGTPVMSDNFNYGGVVRVNNASGDDTIGGIDFGTVPSPAGGGDVIGGIDFGSAPAVSAQNPSDSSDSLASLLSNIAKTAGAIAGSIKSIGGTVNSTASGLNGTLNSIGGGIGASSISQYVSANWMKILFFIIVVVVIILILVHAAKNK